MNIGAKRERRTILRFEEKNCHKIKNLPRNLIYFLLKDGEVLYVGQTTRGLTRPFNHLNKDFDTVMVKEREIDQLDNFEDMMILKYSPKYNKVSKTMYSLLKSRNKIRKIKGYESITVRDIRRMAEELNIKIRNLNNGLAYISCNDFKIIYDKAIGRL